MFSPDITESDAFLEMPASAHSLYFHLGMYADDDGFVNPRKIMRMLGSSEDDLKVLLSKRFLLIFASGVVVVKHWKINNLVRKDWYRPSQYIEEKSLLIIKENGAYTDDLEYGGHFVNEPLTQVRLGKVSISTGVAIAPQAYEITEENTNPKKENKTKYVNAHTAFSWFPRPQKSWGINVTELKHGELLFERGEEKVKSMLEFIREYREEEYFPQVTKPSDLERKWLSLEKKRKELV